MAGRGSGCEDLHDQGLTGGLAIQGQPAVPGCHPAIAFDHELRMTPTPDYLPKRFLRARSPV